MAIRKRDRMILPSWAPWLALLPIGVLGFHSLLGLLAWYGEGVDFPTAVRSPRLEAMARTRVFASLLPFLLTSLFVCFLFVRDYLLLLGRQARRQLLPAILLLLVAAFLGGLQAVATAPGSIGIVGRDVFDLAFKGMEAGSWPLRRVVDLVVLILAVALGVGASAVTLGTLSCLAAPLPTLPPAERAELRRLQRARLERYLYGSACLLVTGLFVIDSVARWPAAFSADPELYNNHVDALMLAQGILYSTMIASYYLPVALWLQGQPPETAEDHRANSDEADGGAGISTSGFLKSIAALLSPAIAGVLAQLIENAGF